MAQGGGDYAHLPQSFCTLLVKRLKLKDCIQLEGVCKDWRAKLRRQWAVTTSLDVHMVPMPAWRHHGAQPFLGLVERSQQHLQEVDFYGDPQLPEYGYKLFLEVLAKMWELNVGLRKVKLMVMPLRPRLLMYLAKFPLIEKLAVISLPPVSRKYWDVIDAMMCLCLHHWSNLETLTIYGANWSAAALEHLPDSVKTLIIQNYFQPGGRRLQMDRLLFNRVHSKLEQFCVEKTMVRRQFCQSGGFPSKPDIIGSWRSHLDS